MKIELLLSPFDATVADIRRAASQADSSGITGLWTMDHLAGTVHAGRHTVLECLATLGVIAQATEQCRVGSLVLNSVSREPVVLAQALSTLQQVAEGRIIAGLGAGGGGGDYGRELESAGMIDHPAPIRRQRLADTTRTLKRVWSEREGAGFLAPDPHPPIVLGGYGPKLATMAGQLTAGFNTIATHHDLSGLLSVARAAAAGRPFESSVFALYSQPWLDPDSPERQRLLEARVDTLIIVTEAPQSEKVIAAVARAAEAIR